MSDDEYMTRGRAQVLYNYMPGKTFDYSGPYGIHRIKSVDAIPSSDADTEFVAKRVISRVRQWRQADDSPGAVGFSDMTSQYQLLEPQKVRSEQFPLLFYCSDCGIVDTYDDPEELKMYNSSITCRQCGGDLRQYRYVYIHECGEIDTPDPGRCNCGSYDHWRLDTQDSQRFENFQWRCGNCGNSKDLYQYCDCNLPDNTMQLAVHSGSTVHIPHHFSLINIKQKTSGSVDSPVYAKKILARYLDLTDTPLDDISLDEAGGGEEVQELKTTLENLQSMYEDSGAPGLKESIEETEARIEELQATTDPLSEVVNDHVSIAEPAEEGENLIADDHADIIYQLRQYLSTRSEFDRKSVRDVITEAGPDDPQSQQARHARADRVEKQLKASGIADATFIEEFPITNVVFGYSRGSRNEEEAILMAFSENQVKTSSEGFPIFVDTVSTEAAQFELNPRAVLAWLLENSRRGGEEGEILRDQLLSAPLPGDRAAPRPSAWGEEVTMNWLADTELELADTEPLSEWSIPEIRAWIVDNMTDIPEYSTLEVDQDTAVTYFVYNLVHTYSHMVLKQITKLSGISRTSLAEHLLPYPMSFIIYSNRREDFSLGGIYTLLESDLDELITEIHSHGNSCVYDPVCSRRGAACFSCMHISEVSCSHLNKNVARDLMFGSKPAATRDLVGYLEIADNYRTLDTSSDD